jgi:hypothetical protein
MQTASHFIGIVLGSGHFVNTFIELQNYFRDNDLEKAVEFQNILSLHITHLTFQDYRPCGICPS